MRGNGVHSVFGMIRFFSFWRHNSVVNSLVGFWRQSILMTSWNLFGQPKYVDGLPRKVNLTSSRWYLHGLPKYALGQPKCVLGLGTYMGQNIITLVSVEWLPIDDVKLKFLFRFWLVDRQTSRKNRYLQLHCCVGLTSNHIVLGRLQINFPPQFTKSNFWFCKLSREINL